MKYKSKLINETNSTVYRRIRNEAVSRCPMCSPHKGCNRWNKSKPTKNWKTYRKHQWKN